MAFQKKLINVVIVLFITLLYLVHSACSKNPFGTEKKSDYSDDFELIWTTVDSLYPFLDFKKINWDSLYPIYLSQVENVEASNVEKIFTMLLTELKDSHANMYDKNNNEIASYIHNRKKKDIDSYDPSLVDKYFDKKPIKLFNGLFKYQILPENVGYVNYSSFSGKEKEYTKFEDILYYFKDTIGMIIDIRHNRGGDNTSSCFIVQRLIESSITDVGYSRVYGQGEQIYYPEGNIQYPRPVVLLINGVSYSASDHMANLLKKVPHVTIVGDTTGGGGGIPQHYKLPHLGQKFRVPTRCMLRYDGEHVEWNGIPPDILVPQTKADIDRNQDIQLEYAISLLSK